MAVSFNNANPAQSTVYELHKGKMNSDFSLVYVLPTGPARSPQRSTRNQPFVQRAARAGRTAHPLGVSNTRTHRRAPQSSSGPRQPERASAGAPPLERRRQHHTKPQSDQRNRNTQKLSKGTRILHPLTIRETGRVLAACKPLFLFSFI